MHAACDPEEAPPIIGTSFLLSIWQAPLFLVLQSALLTHTLHNEYRLRNHKAMKRVSKLARFLCVFLQLMSILWVLGDVLRYGIDPLTTSVRHTALCDFFGFQPQIIPGPYFAVYLFQILHRLDSVFKGSYLALSRYTVYLLWAVLMLLLCGPAIMIVSNVGRRVCLQSWTPSDLSHDIQVCLLPLTDDTLNWLVVPSVMMVTLLNVWLSALFNIKLSKLMAHNKSNKGIKVSYMFNIHKYTSI